MTDSIETIWKEAFMDERTLTVPKITNLYNKKSKNLVDTFFRKFRINLIALAAATLVVPVLMIALKMPILGIFMAVAFGWHGLVGYRNMKRMDAIDKTSNSYDYLKSFQTWLDILIEEMIWMSKIFYPLMGLVLLLQLRFHEEFIPVVDEYLASNPETLTLFATPAWAVGITGIVMTVLYFLAPAIYRLDVKSIYNKDMQRLDETLSDMEALREGA